MRLAFCSTLVLGLAGLAGCNNQPIGESPFNRPTVTAPSDAGAAGATGGNPVSSKPDATVMTPIEQSPPNLVADAAPSKDASVDVSFDAAPASDASDVTDVLDAGAADRAPPPSCAAIAAAGDASQLDTFLWMYEVGPTGGPYSRPYDTVSLAQGCQITYQKTIFPRPVAPAPGVTMRTVTLNGVDCTAMRAWATNARFLDVLSTGDDCPYGMGNPDDEFEVSLTDGTMDRRKTYQCPEPTLDAVRACVSALVARSFP